MGRRKRKRRLSRAKHEPTENMLYKPNEDGSWTPSETSLIPITVHTPATTTVVRGPVSPYDNVFTPPKGTNGVCHHTGEVIALEHEGKQIVAGSYRGIKDRPTCLEDINVVIDCANVLDHTGIVNENSHEEWKFLDNYASIPNDFSLLSLDWADQGEPNVRPEFWEKLWESLPEGKTMVCCLGGHGRTGTVIAALTMVALKSDPLFAALAVRTAHCNEAIESQIQHLHLNTLARRLGLNENAMLAYHILNAKAAVDIFTGNDTRKIRGLIKELRTKNGRPTGRTTSTYQPGWGM